MFCGPQVDCFLDWSCGEFLRLLKVGSKRRLFKSSRKDIITSSSTSPLLSTCLDFLFVCSWSLRSKSRFTLVLMNSKDGWDFIFGFFFRIPCLNFCVFSAPASPTKALLFYYVNASVLGLCCPCRPDKKMSPVILEKLLENYLSNECFPVIFFSTGSQSATSNLTNLPNFFFRFYILSLDGWPPFCSFCPKVKAVLTFNSWLEIFLISLILS